MTNVKLRIAGQNNVKVGDRYPPSAADYLADHFDQDVLNLDAGHTLTTKEFYVAAPSKDPNGDTIDLVAVTIQDWDADLTCILTNAAAQADLPKATFSAEVLSQ